MSSASVRQACPPTATSIATLLRQVAATIALIVVGTTYLLLSLKHHSRAPVGSNPNELMPWASEGPAVFPGFEPGLLIAATLYAVGTVVAHGSQRRCAAGASTLVLLSTLTACAGLVLVATVSVFDPLAWLHVLGVQLFVGGSVVAGLSMSVERRVASRRLRCLIVVEIFLLFVVATEAAIAAPMIDPVQHFVGRSQQNRWLRELEPALVALLAFGWLFAAQYYEWTADAAANAPREIE